MGKPFVHKELSLSEAIQELGFDKLPYGEAMNRLLEYAENGEIDIYFYVDMECTPITNTLTKTFENDGDYALEYEGPSTYIHSSSGRLLLKSGSYDIKEKNSSDISVNIFEQNRLKYYSVISQPDILQPKNINEDSFSIDYKKLLDFIASTSITDSVTKLKSITEDSSRSVEADNILTALTLVAIDLAKKTPRFKNGKKVNCSAFKDYILELSGGVGDLEEYGLNKIDEKISGKLKELNITDISKIK